jgi:hypothetical protein
MTSVCDALGSLQLGFQTSSTGPLTQVSIPLEAIGSAVYLATGAVRSWWKAPAKAQCLEMVLMSNGASLTIPQTFNPHTFKRRVSGYPMRGVALQTDVEGGGFRLRSCALPNASSRNNGPEERFPIRAITIALLCLFDTNTTCHILLDIIREYLLNKDLEGISIEKQGPLSAATLQYIKSVEAEEECNDLREDLLRLLDREREKVTNATLEDLVNCHVFEEPLAIAFLSWVLTSRWKRESPEYQGSYPYALPYSYPMRSFRVWCLAFLLHELGFEVEASIVAISTQEMYKTHVQHAPEDAAFPKVFLITQPVGPQDVKVDRHIRRQEVVQKRRVPIKTIPLMVFEHFRFYKPAQNIPKQTLEDLADIFLYTFEHVQEQLSSFPSIQMLRELETTATTPRYPAHTLSSYQKTKLSDWITGSSAETLLADPISRFLDESCPDQCGQSPCYYPPPFEASNGASTAGKAWKDDVRSRHKDQRPWIIMHMIMLAFAYSTACQCLRNEDGARVDLETEVILTSIPFFERYDDDRSRIRLLIPDGTTLSWVHAMASVIGLQQTSPAEMGADPSPIQGIKRTLYHMVCGANPKNVEAFSVGCYANGLTLLSKCLVKPSVSCTSTQLYFIQFGRILEIPVTLNGTINACSPVAFANRSMPLTLIRRQSADLGDLGNWTVPDVRWDAEPDWERAEEDVGFRCRVHNVPKFIVNPWYLVVRRGDEKKGHFDRIGCSCDRNCPQSKVEFPTNESWFEVDLQDFYQKGGQYGSMSLDQLTEGQKWHIFVRAGSRELDQLVALNLFGERLDNGKIRRILTSCLRCTISFLQREARTPRSALASSHNRHLDIIVISS